MKKYLGRIAVALYVLSAVLYVSSLFFEESRVILMCLGSCALASGAWMTLSDSKNKKA